VIGVEKDPEIYHGARVNVEHLDLSDKVTIKNGDSRKLMEYPWMKKVERIDGIITDPPFGRSAATGGEKTGKLVNGVIEEVLDLIPTGAPLVIDSLTREPLSQVPGFELRDTYEFRIHRSMTRYIGVLSRT
jgi:tRNA (guanine10-N2)-dimethyltransferase